MVEFLAYPDYNIRVSSQKNVNGEKFVLRLLKKNEDIKGYLNLDFQMTRNWLMTVLIRKIVLQLLLLHRRGKNNNII